MHPQSVGLTQHALSGDEGDMGACRALEGLSQGVLQRLGFWWRWVLMVVEGWENNAAMDAMWREGDSGPELGRDCWLARRAGAREMPDALASPAANRATALCDEVVGGLAPVASADEVLLKGLPSRRAVVRSPSASLKWLPGAVRRLVVPYALSSLPANLEIAAQTASPPPRQ